MAFRLLQQMLCTVQSACHHNSSYRRRTLFAHVSAGIGHHRVYFMHQALPGLILQPHKHAQALPPFCSFIGPRTACSLQISCCFAKLEGQGEEPALHTGMSNSVSQAQQLLDLQ